MALPHQMKSITVSEADNVLGTFSNGHNVTSHADLRFVWQPRGKLGRVSHDQQAPFRAGLGALERLRSTRPNAQAFRGPESSRKLLNCHQNPAY